MKKLTLVFAISSLCFSELQAQNAASGSEANATLTIHANKRIAAIPPNLYGIFFEDINMAGDGGVYAEMLRNRSFEDIRPPEGCAVKGDFAYSPGNFRWDIRVSDSVPAWKLDAGKNTNIKMHLDSIVRLNSNQLYAIRIDAPSGTPNKVSLRNEGFWGISADKGKTYKASFFAFVKDAAAIGFEVSLQDTAGNIYASASVNNIKGGWNKYQTSLTATATHHKLFFVLTMQTSGPVWLDMFSLFPADTYNKRENGMRADLMNMLTELKPSFLRFPGGCVVEGITFDNAIQWKETVSDISERPGHVNVWGYRSTDGMGFHEFLQMCEDLKCAPLFVVNVGITCQARNEYYKPLDELAPMIQDVIDAIEYANGPVTSKWGALRAKNGHAEPFGLKYLEIGNENWGEKYDARYLKFYDAVKAKYPDIITIRSAHPTADKNPLFFPENKGDILDLHYYRSPDWLFRNHHILDDYPRVGKKIYIGEYACNEKVGHGNLLSALADASFMMSFERNADIVELASYAPLFENDDKDGYKWPVNLIHFNNYQTYAIPSFYAQKMFYANKGNYTLQSELKSDTALVPNTLKIKGGAIGFDTYSTEAVFDDVLVISGKDTLLFEDFSNAATKFPLQVVSGNWKVENGELHQVDAGVFAHAVMGNPSWKNYTITFRAKKISGMEGFFMTAAQNNADNYIKWNIGGWNNTQHALEMRNDGSNTWITPMVAGSVKAGEWYRVKMEVTDRNVKCYLNDALVHNAEIVENNRYQRVYSVVTTDTVQNTVIIKMVNPFSETATIAINLDGKENVKPEGEEVVLTSANPNDNNSFAAPLKVTPVTKTIGGMSKKFVYNCKPYSLVFLKIKLDK